MPHRMNVLMISDVYFPRLNGVSTSIQTFRDDLRRMGHRVELVAPSYVGQPGRIGESGVIRIAGWRVPNDPEDRFMRWDRLHGTLADLAAGHWDVIHVHTPFLAHSAGVGLAAKTGTPLVITYHTLFEEYLEHYVPLAPRRATRGLARRMSRHQCHQADAVVAPSRAMADRLVGYGVSPARIHVLPTGLPDSVYERGDRNAFRRRHDIAPDRPVALFVGRLAHEKNIGFLLAALAEAKKRVPGLLLLVAGDGPAAESLREEARRLGVSEDVRFLGYVSRGRPLADCYAAADVFAFASRTETQGLVLLEAMAQGVPVLALAEMGTREILEGNPGALIGRDDADAFGRQLAGLLSQPSLIARMGEEARESAEAWRGPVLAGRLLDLYGGLSPRRGGRHRMKATRDRSTTPAWMSLRK